MKQIYCIVCFSVNVLIISCSTYTPNAYIIEPIINDHSGSVHLKINQNRSGIFVDYSDKKVINGETIVKAKYGYRQCWIPLKSIVKKLRAEAAQNKQGIFAYKSVIIKNEKDLIDHFTKKKILLNQKQLAYYIYSHIVHEKKKCYLVGLKPILNAMFYQKEDFIGWIEQDKLIFWNTNIAGFDKHNHIYVKTTSNYTATWYKRTTFNKISHLNIHFDHRFLLEPIDSNKGKSNFYTNNSFYNKWNVVNELPELEIKYYTKREEIESTVVFLNNFLELLVNKRECLQYGKKRSILSEHCKTNNTIQSCLNQPLLIPVSLSIMSFTIEQISKSKSIQNLICETQNLRDKYRYILSGKKFTVVESYGPTGCIYCIEPKGSHNYFERNNYLLMNLSWLKGEK